MYTIKQSGSKWVVVDSNGKVVRTEWRAHVATRAAKLMNENAAKARGR